MTREEALQKALAAAGRAEAVRANYGTDLPLAHARLLQAHAAEAQAWATIALALPTASLQWPGQDPDPRPGYWTGGTGTR